MVAGALGNAEVQRINMALPDEAARELVFNADLDDERVWVPRGENVWTRPLLFNVNQGSWVGITRAKGTGVVSRHRHPAPVTGYTFEGSWGYVEHEWTATAGTFIFEPAG
ncbi:MAG: cupin domain-containing protein, partial [Gammaproteobacteria bacterium]|nr:cupin domain-containing protein [Gammaproteobacteria bacterium]